MTINAILAGFMSNAASRDLESRDRARGLEDISRANAEGADVIRRDAKRHQVAVESFTAIGGAAVSSVESVARFAVRGNDDAEKAVRMISDLDGDGRASRVANEDSATRVGRASSLAAALEASADQFTQTQPGLLETATIVADVD